MAKTPSSIEWCVVHQANGRGFDPDGVERCLYATVDLLINERSPRQQTLDSCRWVRVIVELVEANDDR